MEIMETMFAEIGDLWYFRIAIGTGPKIQRASTYSGFPTYDKDRFSSS